MTYEEAKAEIEERLKKFPATIENGRVWIVINGKKFPKDWFANHCIRMRLNGEI